MRLLVLFAFLVSTAPAPKQAYTANGAVAAQPLHEVIMQVFDKDHNGKVSLPEVDKSLTSFAAMAGAFGGDTAGPNKMAEMVEAARNRADPRLQWPRRNTWRPPWPPSCRLAD